MFALAPLATSVLAGIGQAVAGSGSASSATAATDAKLASHAKMKKTAQDFEKMFLEQTMDRVNNSENSEGPLGENGTGGGIYRSMMNKEYAGAIVKSGGVGISDQIYKQMLSMQEGSGAAR